MPDFVVTIEVRDVATGDIRNLAEEIMREHGDNFDAPRGDFTIRAALREGGSTFPLDLEADDD